jgi:hypothetical protein
MSETFEGGCLCGDVRYRARGAPMRVNACHCTFCQKLTGSAYHVGVTFPSDAVSFAGAAPRVYEHVSDGSGKPLRLHSCARCGTTVALTLGRFPGVVALLRGTLDEPDRVVPERHLFVRSAQRGTLLPAATECYAAFRLDADDRPLPPASYPRTMVSDGRGRPLREADGD